MLTIKKTGWFGYTQLLDPFPVNVLFKSYSRLIMHLKYNVLYHRY
jgi:hypothetical protein